MNNNFEVALTKSACYVCLKEVNSEIIINTRLDKKAAEAVKKYHNKITKFDEELCLECKELANQGIIMIGVIEELTEDKSNPYRSGKIVVIKEGGYKRLFGKEIPDKRIAHIEHELGISIGLWED